MLKLLCIGLGGSCGAIFRYLFTTLVHQLWTGVFPLGTLLVNFLGAVFMGMVTQWAMKYEINTTYWLPFLTTGLLGGFTTFSTFSLETVNLISQGQYVFATVNIIASVCLCLLGIFFGSLMVRLYI